MRLSNGQLRRRLQTKQKFLCSEQSIQETMECSRRIFCENQAKELLSDAEFLYLQSRYIRKYWWVLQGGILLALWFVLKLTGSSAYERKAMGIGASLFAVLLLPELWKNKSFHALEIESASYYSLRQIYAARMFLFATVDFILLSAFFLIAIYTGRLGAEEIMIHFFLPYLVTCCICFYTLYHAKLNSQLFAILSCMLWCVLWTQFVLNEKMYEIISQPIWYAATVMAALYLGYCIKRGQRNCCRIWEA